MSEIRDELWLRSPSGVLQVAGVRVTAFDWTLEENAFHVLHATGPWGGPDDLDTSLLVQDARFEVHRYLDGLGLGTEGQTQFFLRYWKLSQDMSGAKTWTVEAYSPEYFLSGRIVDSFASTENDTNALTTKSGTADDLILAFVDENIGPSTTDTARKVAELAIDDAPSLGPSTDKGAAWDNLLAVINDLVQDAYYQNVWLSWGMTVGEAGYGYTFHVWKDQRGVDNTAIVVSEATGNLAAPAVAYDHRAEWTSVRGLGKGEGRGRAQLKLTDDVRSEMSGWAFREKKIETQCENADTLTAAANTELARGNPWISFTGKFIDTDAARYGVDFNFGDVITAEAFGISFPCRLSRIKGSWSRDTAEMLDIDLAGSVPE